MTSTQRIEHRHDQLKVIGGIEEATDDRITIEISRVAAFQPERSTTPRSHASAGEKFTATLSHTQPVVFEVALKLDGERARERAISLSRFEVEVYAYNRSTSVGECIIAVERGCVQAESHTYAMKLPAMRLASGTYRLECTVGLDNAPSTKGYVEIPYLRVV